jgi:LysM repeat protein
MLGLIFVSFIGFSIFSQEAYGSQEEKVIIVEPGDTLWSIAQANYPDDNTQKAIYYITKANALDSSNLKIGSELHLPIF